MTDDWGPARVTSFGGWKYYISFCDDSVRYFFYKIKERWHNGSKSM